MADDIEAFLRRAAQRSRAKQSQAKSAPQPNQTANRQRPNNPSASQSRAIEITDADIVDVVPVSESGRYASGQSHLAAQVSLADDKMNEHLRDVFDHSIGELKQTSPVKSSAPPSANVSAARRDNDQSLRASLLKLMTSPRGLQQAIVMRELLERPEHRWE